MANKDTPQDKFIKERIARVEYWEKQLDAAAKIINQLRLDLEQAKKEATALAARAGIRVAE